MADQLGPIIAILLFFGLIINFDWEIPVDIGDAWLKVVAGFPCLLYSKYQSHSDASPWTKFSPIEPRNLLGWNCDRLSSLGNSCFSILSICPVGFSSQFSVAYWDRGNVSCKKDGRRVECEEIRETSGICQNIVTMISNVSNAAELELDDYRLPSPIYQKYELHDFYRNGCYQQGDRLEARSFNRTAEVFHFYSARYRVNSTFKISLQRQGCQELQQILDPDYLTNSQLCNCGVCDVPISSEDTKPENGSCILPVKTDISIISGGDKIIGAVLNNRWEEVNANSAVEIIYKVFFPPYESTVVTSRFSSSKGRFHCPSELTCWKELWYPLTEWTQLETYKIVLIMILAGVLSLMFLKKR